MDIPRALLFFSDLAQLALTTIIGCDNGASLREGSAGSELLGFRGSNLL